MAVTSDNDERCTRCPGRPPSCTTATAVVSARPWRRSSAAICGSVSTAMRQTSVVPLTASAAQSTVLPGWPGGR